MFQIKCHYESLNKIQRDPLSYFIEYMGYKVYYFEYIGIKLIWADLKLPTFYFLSNSRWHLSRRRYAGLKFLVLPSWAHLVSSLYVVCRKVSPFSKPPSRLSSTFQHWFPLLFQDFNAIHSLLSIIQLLVSFITFRTFLRYELTTISSISSSHTILESHHAKFLYYSI